MTQAIFSLIGVLVGGMIAATATFAMARRSENAKARAAARLLEDDLKTMRTRIITTIEARRGKAELATVEAWLTEL